MSSSSSCHGFQSCLEPAFVIEPPRVLRLKLAPSNSSASSNDNVETGGWSFLQSLGENHSVYKDEPYNPPNSKRGSSVLSEKSLEMCTESLGSETGSESSDEIALLSSENYDESGFKYSRLRETTRRMSSQSSSFPPPLTSISSSSTVQIMRRRREDGRLVLEAVSVPACFQAERIDGRLRLHLLKDCDSEEEEEEDDEEFEEEEEEEEKGEMGKEKLTRLSCRCKEGGNVNKSMINWEPLWVAT